MKTYKCYLILILTVCVLISCSKDEKPNVTTIPEFQNLTDELSSLPGETFTIKGVVSDPAGIASVNLKYESWFLDKTIYKDSLPETYELSYSFKVPDDAVENSSHTIEITTANAGGKTTSKNVLITLDQDILKPTIQITAPIDGATVLIGDGEELNFNINVTDASLAEFKIESAVLNETIAISGESYNYTKALDITDAGAYTFTITATDATGNAESKTLKVNVLNELLFDVMYITDVTNESLLTSDLFGIPYATDASEIASEDGYVFTGKYYSPTPNTEVRFLPQKGSFEPYTFGSNPAVEGELVLGSGADVDPIVLPEMGYYEVVMDLRNQTYTVTPYTPTDDTFAQVYILGTGVYINDTESTCTNNTTGETTCWNFQSGKPFTKDANSNYLWTIDVTLKEEPNNDGNNGFILNANPEGWSPFWRVDDGDDPEATVFNGGANFIFPDSALDKDYTFIFDTHLNRIAAIRR